jgi:hypothetical protein
MYTSDTSRTQAEQDHLNNKGWKLPHEHENYKQRETYEAERARLERERQLQQKRN